MAANGAAGVYVAAVFQQVESFRGALGSLLEAGFQAANISILGEHQSVADHFGGEVPTAKEISDRLDTPREPVDDEQAVEKAVRILGESLSIVGTIGAAGLAYAVGGPVGVAVGAGTATETKIGDVLLGRVDRHYAERFEHSIRDGGLVCWVHAYGAEEAERAAHILTTNGGIEVHQVGSQP